MSGDKSKGILRSLLKWLAIGLGIALMIWIQSFLRKAPDAASTSEASDAGDTSGLPVQTLELTAGDVEAKSTIAANIPAASRTANMKIDEMINPKKNLDMVTVDITPPFPAELPIQFKLNSFLALENRSVAIRGNIYVDNKPVQAIEGVWTGPTPVYPVFDMPNALAGLAQPPATMLVHLRAEVMLVPPGIDPATVKVSELTVADEAKGTLVSNPVRINFKS